MPAAVSPVCAVSSTWCLPTRAQCAVPVCILLLPSAMPAAELQLLSVEERSEALQASGLSATQVEDVETMLSGGCYVGFREGSWGNEEAPWITLSCYYYYLCRFADCFLPTSTSLWACSHAHCVGLGAVFRGGGWRGGRWPGAGVRHCHLHHAGVQPSRATEPGFDRVLACCTLAD